MLTCWSFPWGLSCVFVKESPGSNVKGDDSLFQCSSRSAKRPTNYRGTQSSQSYFGRHGPPRSGSTFYVTRGALIRITPPLVIISTHQLRRGKSHERSWGKLLPDWLVEKGGGGGGWVSSGWLSFGRLWPKHVTGLLWKYLYNMPHLNFLLYFRRPFFKRFSVISNFLA